MKVLMWILVTFDVCVCYQHTLLFNTPKDIRIAHQKARKPTVIVKDLQDSFALDFLFRDSLICWTDHAVEQIDCIIHNSSYTGSRTTYVNHVVPKPEGLACDWLTRKLYWTDNESKRIEVVSMGSKHRKVLYWTDLEMPRGIALDPLEGYMFWTDWSDPPKIERASMDGDLASRKIIIQEYNIFWPNSVSLDVVEKKLYWMDGKHTRIEVTDYDGRQRTTVAERVSAYPFALSFADPRIYWTDWKNFSIYSIDKDGRSLPTEIIHFAKTPIVDIEVYNASRQPYKQTPCESNNGGCSHLCLLSSSNSAKFSCACPIGIKLKPDNKTCSSNFESFILLVQRSEISIMSLDTPDYSSMRIPLRNVTDAMGIDYDPVDEFFYWTDIELQVIRRAKLDGSRQENIVTFDVLSPNGLAVDWIARNLYWTDSVSNRIEVVRLNTAYRKVVIYKNLEKPRAVVVAPVQGWLFWSDWNDKKPKIERSDLDGANRLTLVEKDLSWPNGLALDYHNNRVYWGDARTNKIEVVGMDGRNRREVVSDNLPHVFGLSLLGDNLYWTDWQRRSLEVVTKFTSSSRSTILDSLMDVMGIKAVSTNSHTGTNLCAINNGNCSQFCLNKHAGKFVCACQIEFELDSDNRTCIIPRAYVIVHNDTQMMRVSVKNEFSQDIMPIQISKSIDAIDVNVGEDRMYWVDIKSKSISRCYFNGSKTEKVVSYGLGSPESLAIDWLSSNMYWTDVSKQRIEVAKLNGQYRRTLFWSNLNEPRTLVLDPREGFMFFSEWDGDAGFITKAHMDGSMRRVIINDVSRISGLALDYIQWNLYWTRSTTTEASIDVCDSNGQNRRKMFSSNTYRPHTIAQNQNFLYFGQWANESLVKVNKHDGSIRQVFRTRLDRISDVKVVDLSKPSGWNDCALNNGGCKNLCLVRPGISPHSTDIICACSTHYVLKDGLCQSPDHFLIFSQNNALYRLTTSVAECPDAPLPVPGLRGIRAIEYESATKSVFWIDKMSTIKRSNENGTHAAVVIGGKDQPEEVYSHLYDMALEPFSKLLFWSCSASDAINVTRLNNSSLGCIFRSKNGQKPRNLAIHPEKGFLFWSDVGNQPHISQARLDGEIKQRIGTDGQIVDSLSVDRRSNLLYYSYSGNVFEYNVADKSRRHFYSTGTQRLSSIAVIQSFLYWINRDAMRIERGRININTLSEVTTMLEMPSLVELISVDPIDDSYPSHPCSAANNVGNCSHLCMPSMSDPTKAECGCPLSFKLAEDERTCLSVPVCGANHFICKSIGSECIPIEWKCDHGLDCQDGSDEDAELCNRNHYNSSIILLQEDLLKNDSYVEDGGNGDAASVFAIVAILVIVGGTFVGTFLFIKLTRPAHKNHRDEAVMRPLAPDFSSPIDLANSKSMALPMTLMNGGTTAGSGGGSSYERSHVTGVSSSTSIINCPLNPPPSPTTTTMHADECDCMPYLTVPTSTPCSTDVCDESDATYRTDDFLAYCNRSTTYHRRGPDRRERGRLDRNNRHQRSEIDYYREMGATPPPTPRSGSDPPSPRSTP